MNCIIVDDDELVVHAMEALVKEIDFLHLVKSCRSAMEANNILLKEKIDLIFLDVMMPKMTGIELMKMWGENIPLVIMITSNKEFASDAFDFDVCDFILKPITRARFFKAVFKAKGVFTKNQGRPITNNFFVKVDSVLVRVNEQDIIYIEALADYVTVQTATKKYILKSTMKNILRKLPQNNFIRVHNSFIVRVDKINTIEDANIIVNKKVIPISRNKRKNLMNKLKIV